MANKITTTFSINGSYKFMAVIQIELDGASGEYSAQAVIDPKAAIAGVQAAAGMTGLPSDFKIESIDWEFTSFTAALYWKATANVLACALPQYDGRLDFKQSGAPLINNSGAGKDGKLLLTTVGANTGGTAKQGTIIIKGYHTTNTA